MTRTAFPLAVALAASTALTSVSSVAQAQETLYRWKWEGAIYNRFVIADGALQESYGALGEGLFQACDFTQTPAVVDATTDFISLSGKLY